MQDVNRVADIQSFPEPARRRRVGIQGKSVRLMARSDDRDWIARHLPRSRNVWHDQAVRAPKLQRTVHSALDLIPLLVDRPVVSATQQREVGQRRGTAMHPVADVMTMAEANAAAWKPAAAIPMVESSP